MEKINNRGNKYGIYYHIFSDNIDLYTNSFKKANSLYNELKQNDCTNIRLYQCWCTSKENVKKVIEGLYEVENEDCLRISGDFPM